MQAPIVIAFDGSPAAQGAVRCAADLFAGRRAIVLTAWDPQLGEMMLVPDPTGMGTASLPYDPALAREIDHEVERSAHTIAAGGAELARSLGLEAEDLVVQDAPHPAEAILAAAAERSAAAIVVGSRGHGLLRAKLLGSTANRILKGAGERPVVIVHAVVEQSQDA